jgi:cysteine synthase A
VARIYQDNSLSIGHTPLVELHRVTEGAAARVLVKVEGRNPAYSVKCRVGAAMIWDAEEKGLLGPGRAIVEPTSGNTGIALAFVAASRGYPITLTMPDTMTMERRKILAVLGAKLVLTPGAEGMNACIDAAQRIVDQDPGRWYMPNQFANPSNPAIHQKTTGPEIWDDTDGAVDAVIAGVGTGGTITGITRYLKLRKAVVSVAVEPVESAVLTQRRAGQELRPGPHKIQGIGAGFVPDVLDLSIIDRIETISTAESMEMARRLAREEGILSGVSGGAAVAVAVRLGHLPEFAGKMIVVILPDSGERYLSGPLFEGLFDADSGVVSVSRT